MEDNPYIVALAPDEFNELLGSYENFVEWCKKEFSDEQQALADRVLRILNNADATHVCVDEQRPGEMSATEYLHMLLRQVEELPEILGSAEDILVDDAAMTLLNDSIEKITLHMRYSLQQGIVDTSVTLTEYLCTVFTANDVARRQVLSLINEKGYEQEAAYRLYEWCSGHITVLLNPTVVNNPYEVPWPTWMMKMLLEALQQVDWNDLVERLRKTLSSPLNEVEQKQ